MQHFTEHDGAEKTTSTILHRRSEPQSPYLVVINKGPGALPVQREPTGCWDLLEIYFTEADIQKITNNPALSDANYVVFENDRLKRKFAIIKCISEQSQVISAYNAVMLLDDDIEPVDCKISSIFGLFMSTGCRIGQPALSLDSYWSHQIVLQNKRFKWRLTNFVEVMCPILTIEAMADYLPDFDDTTSSFGLDNYWSAKEWQQHGGLAILDATPVRHVRPVRAGGAYKGISAEHDRLAFFREKGLRHYIHRTLAGCPLEGEERLLPKNIIYWRQLKDIILFTVRLWISKIAPWYGRRTH